MCGKETAASSGSGTPGSRPVLFSFAVLASSLCFNIKRLWNEPKTKLRIHLVSRNDVNLALSGYKNTDILLLQMMTSLRERKKTEELGNTSVTGQPLTSQNTPPALTTQWELWGPGIFLFQKWTSVTPSLWSPHWWLCFFHTWFVHLLPLKVSVTIYRILGWMLVFFRSALKMIISLSSVLYYFWWEVSHHSWHSIF